MGMEGQKERIEPRLAAYGHTRVSMTLTLPLLTPALTCMFCSKEQIRTSFHCARAAGKISNNAYALLSSVVDF